MARERRLAFGEVAELYDRARPSYPTALVEDVLALAPAESPPRILEVGAGTGKATVLFAARGAAVLALEPSPAMAAVAERNCATYPNVVIERSDFEHWRPDGVTFTIVFAAQAWHWVSREVRYVRARDALREGGVLAAAWNHAEWERCALVNQLREAYRIAAPEFLPDGPMHPEYQGSLGVSREWQREIEAAVGFGQAEARRYRWSCRYSTEQYVRLLRTHSDHIVLDRDRREALFAKVAEVLEKHGGELEVSYVSLLCLASAHGHRASSERGLNESRPGTGEEGPDLRGAL